MSFLEECSTRSSNLKPIITVPKVNLAIRTASSCSRSSSGPPSPRWSTSCWLGPAAPLLRAAPFAFLRCVFCLLVFPLSLVLDLIQFCFVLLGVFDIRSLRTQLPSAHSPTWSFPWVTTETLGLARKRWEAAADSNLFWCDTNFLLWCQNSTRYSFKPCIGEKTTPFDWCVKWGKFVFTFVQLSTFLAWLPWIFDRQHNAMTCVGLVQVRGVLLLALNWLAMNIGLGIGLAALLRDLPLKVFNSTWEYRFL